MTAAVATTKTEPAVQPAAGRRSAIVALASRMGVEPDQLFLSSLRQVAFKSPNATNEQLLALCVVANQYQLNPFTKELFAFPDKSGGVVPIVSVDGWARIMNDHEQFDGMEFVEPDDGAWCECVIYRKDRAHPLKAREFLAECRRNTEPWKQWPRRMLRHKAMIQAARMAFGFAGIYDPDEGERIIEGQTLPAMPASASRTEQAKAALAGTGKVASVAEQAAGEVDDIDAQAIPHFDEKTAIEALHSAPDVATLKRAWDDIRADFLGSNRQIPLPVEAAFNERMEAISQERKA